MNIGGKKISSRAGGGGGGGGEIEIKTWVGIEDKEDKGDRHYKRSWGVFGEATGTRGMSGCEKRGKEKIITKICQ